MLGLLALTAMQGVTYNSASKWTLDYQEDLCLLTRPFSSTTGNATLGFRQAPADFQVEIIVLVAEDVDSERRRGIVRVGFPGALSGMLTGAAVSYRIPDSRQRMLRFLVRREVLTDFALQQAITIEELGQQPITFRAAGAEKAIQALAGCETDQMKAWGIDVAQMATPATPIGDVGQWFAFPPLAAANRQAGETTVRWTIGANGKVADCRIVRSSGNATLDGSVCKQVVKRAVYEPAIDKDGQPMMWVETRRIVWSIGSS